MDKMQLSWRLISVIEAANKARWNLQFGDDTSIRYWLEKLDAEMRQVDRTVNVAKQGSH